MVRRVLRFTDFKVKGTGEQRANGPFHNSCSADNALNLCGEYLPVYLYAYIYIYINTYIYIYTLIPY